jgi:protein TonB
MSYAQQQRDPAKHFAGIAFVVVFHIVLVYALVNGLGRKVIDVIKQPLQVSLIEEAKPLPPPPPKLIPKAAPHVAAPPPPVYTPPPEVKVEAPPPVPNTVVATTPVPPPVETAPPAPPAPPTPAPAPAPVARAEPAVVDVGVVCPNHKEVLGATPFPKQALKLGLSGDVTVEFEVNPDGSIANAVAVKSSNRVFNAVAIEAVSKNLHCVGQGQRVRARLPFTFRLDS